MVDSGGNGRTVTSRVLAILDAFSWFRPEQSLSEISRAADLPLSTVHRLVHELTGWGALERTASGRYRIGLRLWEVGSLAPRWTEIRGTAVRYVADLFAQTGDNVALTMLDDDSALCLEWIFADGSAHLLGGLSNRIPLHASGAGLVLLAHAPLDVRQRILEGPLPRLGRATYSSSHDLRRALFEVRRRGYAVSCRQLTDHCASVAAPVSIGIEGAVAAISVILPAEEDWRTRVPIVVDVARELTAALKAHAGEWRPA